MLRVVEASSVLLVRNAVQVLMVQRSRKASFQPGVWVFPGGTRDPADPDLRITAIRELFEETGVLLADGPNDTMHRDWVHGDARVFGEFYRDAMVDSLKLVSRWYFLIRCGEILIVCSLGSLQLEFHRGKSTTRIFMLLIYRTLYNMKYRSTLLENLMILYGLNQKLLWNGTEKENLIFLLQLITC
jgi:8-oxo-dGTP pyrophosphatase MutT (NUDIX family)